MNKLFVTAILILMIAAGCKKSELMKYEGSDGLYFSTTRIGTLPSTDSMQISFATRPGVILDSAVFDIRVLGQITGSNRPFILQVDKQLTSAVAGEHYDLPSQDSFFIPAGTESKRIAIMIRKPASLYDTTVTLELRLMPNEHFQTDMKMSYYTFTSQVKATSMRIVITDKLLKPPVWEASANALGTYSRLKIDMMVSVLGLRLPNFYGTAPYAPAQLTNFSKAFQQYLNKQKGLGNTIYEKDGTEMKMGPAAQ